MNIFQIIWTYLVWQPQINLLKFSFNITQDIGVAIALMTVIVNIPLWFLYGKSYINLQKSKVLQPKILALKEKYKDDPMEFRKATLEFNKKHGVDLSGTFQMMFFQLFFVTGLFSIVNVIDKGKEVNYLYSSLWGSDVFTFPTKTFGGLDISDSVHNQFWIVILTSLLSYIYGLYTFKWSPQIKVAPPKNQTPEQKQQAIAMERSQNFIGIYLTPILFLFINFGLPLGVNIYSLVASVLSLLRQVIVTNHYAKHTQELIQQMDDSDPNPSTEYKLKQSKNNKKIQEDESIIVDVVDTQNQDSQNKLEEQMEQRQLKLTQKQLEQRQTDQKTTPSHNKKQNKFKKR